MANKKVEAYHRVACIIIVKEMIMKAFMERKEAVKKAFIHIIKTEWSVKVQRIKVEPKGSSIGDYKLELKAFVVVVGYIEVDLPFRAFENSSLLNFYLS